MLNNQCSSNKQSQPKADTDIQLISHILCPYVQRSAILLAEQNTPFKRIDIDLANKPAWFKQVSPLGKVPILRLDEKNSLFESQVICEYLNDINPESLHPDTAYEKARHRAWIEFGSGILASIASLYSVKDKASFIQVLETIQNKLGQLEGQLSQSPYFCGEKFLIIDAVYGPIFRYFDTLEKIVSDRFFDNKPKLNAWRLALLQRPSVQDAVASDYPEKLAMFLKARQGYLASLMI
jgi:glutathione S-transferase